MITKVRDPARRHVPREQNWQKTSMPTRPYMIDGIPESVSAANSIIATSFLLVAYSLRYIAAPTPSGSTMINVAITMYIVLSMSGRIPIVFLSVLGFVRSKSRVMFGRPLNRTYKSMKNVNDVTTTRER